MFSLLDVRAQEIRGRFISRASEEEPRILSIMMQLEGPAQTEAVEELKQISHKLAGSAATLGFHDIGKAAQSLEAELTSQQSAGTMDAAALTVLCNRLLATLREAIQPATDAPRDGM